VFVLDNLKQNMNMVQIAIPEDCHYTITFDSSTRMLIINVNSMEKKTEKKKLPLDNIEIK
jgi:hypothetical protein